MPIQLRNVAVFGAAGAIGHAVGAELQRRGIAFRAVGRSRQKLEKAFAGMPLAEVFPADLSQSRSAGAAARGVDAIVYCVGLPYPSHQLHPVLMRTTLEAAKLVGVPRLFLPSSVYSYGIPRTARVAETHPREPHTRKGQYRKEQEDLVMQAHADGTLQAMILRLPDFYGPHADIGLANPIFRAALAGKSANWAGPINTLHEFVYTPDVGPVLLDLAVLDDAYGQAWNFGGAASINSLDFITRIYRAAGRAPKYRIAGAGLLRVLGWFNAELKEVIEMLYLQERPVILDDSKLLARIPVRKTSYDDGIRQTLEWMRG
ncbi:MAG: NAD-dependent epimerase/dehydratase family protein [Candidatus Solibacter sp.]